MRYLRYGITTFVIVLAGLTGSCSVRAQDFSTVPDFPQDFTLVDPNAPSAGTTSTDSTTKSTTTTTTTPSSSSTTTTPTPTTAQPVTKTIPDTASGPESLRVITIAALIGFVLLGALRFHKLTSFHEHQD